jgi:hypothetical protein
MPCHSFGSTSPFKYFLMTSSIYYRASMGRDLSMSDVTPVDPGAVPGFILLMAPVPSS